MKMNEDLFEVSRDIGTILQGMHIIWEHELSDLDEYFDKTEHAIIDFKEALDEAHERLAYIMAIVESEKEFGDE